MVYSVRTCLLGQLQVQELRWLVRKTYGFVVVFSVIVCLRFNAGNLKNRAPVEAGAQFS